MADDFETQFSRAEEALWEDAVGEDFHDTTAEALYHAAYFDFAHDYNTREREAIQTAFREYMAEQYNMDWDAEFDWEAYRESYGEAA